MVPESYMRVVQEVKTASTCALLADFAWDVFHHSPYSPDLAPSDFHLFTYLKQFLGGTCIVSNEEVKMMVKDWFDGLATDFYDGGIQKLITQCKCQNLHED
jgi:histone-lysine N-methyltransferase SETMAR